jgi:hypothetical protein
VDRSARCHGGMRINTLVNAITAMALTFAARLTERREQT